MKPRFILLLFFAAATAGCGKKKQERPATAFDTGRAFIRASLDGDFKSAEELLVQDSANLELFDSYKNHYNRLPEATKDNYRKASVEINKLTEENDSTVIINYSNSYMKKPMEIRLDRIEGVWMIDFEYMYSAEKPAP